MFIPRIASKSQQGVALLLTLLVITVMVLTVGQISYSTKVEVKIAENFRDDLQNKKAAQSGIHMAHAFLRIDAKKKNKDEVHCLHDAWASNIQSQTVGNSSLSIEIKDEERKFNLFRLVDGTETAKKTAKDQFIRLIKYTFEDPTFDAEGMTELLLKWMNNDDGIRGEFKAKVPLYSLNEIKLIPDFMDSFFPEGEDRTYTLSSLLEKVTIFSTKQININTADPEVLRCLHEDFPNEFIAAIAAKRQSGDECFKNLNELQTELDIGSNEDYQEIFNEIQPYLTTKSENFLATITASQGNLARVYRAYFEHSKKETKLIHWELAE